MQQLEPESWEIPRAQRIRQLALELEFEMHTALSEGDSETRRICDEAYRTMRLSMLPYGQPQEPSPDDVLSRVLNALSGT